MQRSLVAFGILCLAIAAFVFACSSAKKGSGFTDQPDYDASANVDVPSLTPDAMSLGTQADAPLGCMGLQCQGVVDNCTAKGKAPTTITGVVYDPAGALPLYDVYVYIPNGTPEPIKAGSPTCTQCQAPASGDPIIGTLTDANGAFTLKQGPGDKWAVPSGEVPLVVQVGKWRHQTKISVTACETTKVPNPSTPSQKLRLPAKSSEGDMPLMAFTSGCDPAECFLRHIGIDDSEFVPPTSTTGHVHFYPGQSGSQVANDTSSYTDTYTWWSSSANLLKYDIVFNACECSENDRGTAAYPAMHDYLTGGGRLFTTHYYYNWFIPPDGVSGAVSDYNSVVNWMPGEAPTYPAGDPEPTTFFVDTTFPKGKAFADWLQGNQITQTLGELSLVDTRNDMSNTTAASSRWIYNAASTTATVGDYSAMYMSFNTPVGKPASQQCGRAVFSDVHLSGSSDGSQFPQECVNADPGAMYSTNEKALEFLFFDLSSCVQDNSQPPPPPTNQ